MTRWVVVTGRWLAVSLPVLGVALMVLRAEVLSATGTRFRVRISGYEPRDLLRGQYLRYQYDFNWQGADRCGAYPDDGRVGVLRPDCCLCLKRRASLGDEPAVTQVDCEQGGMWECDGWLRAREVMPPQKYFIPEASAQALDRALRTDRAALDIVVTRRGELSVQELYLNGQPWRTVVGAK